MGFNMCKKHTQKQLQKKTKAKE